MMMLNRQHIEDDVIDFGFSNPLKIIEIDIGSSKGEFLCKKAIEFPTVNFIGIEIVTEKCRVAERSVQRLGLSNVYIVNMEANEFITEHVSNDAVYAVHIYFPSPYPVRDLGLKHRLITENFLFHVYRILKSGGILRIVTDHIGYLNQIDKFIRDDKRWWPVEWAPPYKNVPNGFIIGTHWEYKLAHTKKIIYLQVLK